MNHLAIYLHNRTGKQQVIQSVFNNHFNLPFATNVLLFNDGAIERLIDKERRYDKYLVTTSNNKSIGSMSSGEQKRAVLQHFINQKPGLIILDDWSGNLDKENIAYLQQLIADSSNHILFVQLFYRRNDVLPFIQNVITVNDDNSYNTQTRRAFLQTTAPPGHFAFEKLPHLFEWIIDCNPLVELKNVTVSYDERPVLNNINWIIRPGEFWQLKGPNGSGKTTLTGMIIGDNPKGYGQNMYLFGRKKGSGESVWDIKKNIGYFYPSISLFFTRNDTVENMIISGLVDSIGLYQLPTEQQQHIAQQWLQLLGPQSQNKRFNDLTPGQQRIVLVIRAIVKLPPLLILDEPAAGLDDDNTEIFITLINALAAMKKIAIIYISHRIEPQIKPDKVFELVKGDTGSIGKEMVIQIAEK